MQNSKSQKDREHNWETHRLREAALLESEKAIQSDGAHFEARFERARLLTELARKEDAKSAYLELLALVPDHFGALNNLGALLHEMGFRTAARTCYAEAVRYHPLNPLGHVNLANAYLKGNDLIRARSHYDAALRIDPHYAKAHQGLANLLLQQGKTDEADDHRRQGFANDALCVLPYRGKEAPLPVLIFVSSMGGNLALEPFLDDLIFGVTVIVTEFFAPRSPLPPHHILINAIGDADLCKPGLEAAVRLAAFSEAPVINPPDKVLLTGRVANAERLGKIEGVRAPRMQQFSRKTLQQAGGLETLQRSGFVFPFLLRTPGFHNGQNFFRIENAQDFSSVLTFLPGEDVTAIEFLDGRAKDNLIRKYRVMFVDGEIFPLHAAVASQWKIHYVSAEMDDHPERRAEDAAFLQNMAKVLGPSAMRALSTIEKTLGLDYAGIDFSLSETGAILVFEANATMVVHPPEAHEKWAYRREPVERILSAVRKLMRRKAKLYQGGA